MKSKTIKYIWRYILQFLKTNTVPIRSQKQKGKGLGVEKG